MNDSKLDFICDLNLYVAKYIDLNFDDCQDASLICEESARRICDSFKRIGDIKFNNENPRALLMISVLLDAAAEITEEIETELS